MTDEITYFTFIFSIGCPGPVSCMKWTPDGTALVMAWQRGGFSIWSTFGAMIMCSLCWDYGPMVSHSYLIADQHMLV